MGNGRCRAGADLSIFKGRDEMATVTYTELLGFRGHLEDNYQGVIVTTGTQSPKLARYNDADNGNYFTIAGTGLTYDVGGNLTGGTITAIDFNSADDVPFAVFDDAHYNAAKLWHTFQTSGLSRMLTQALSGKDAIEGTLLDDDLSGAKGNDTISAGNGDDLVHGGLGNDRLTGGKGNDVFYFNKGEGRDVITDFDADGKRHDMIAADDTNLTIERHGDDTLVRFDDGSSITLMHVKASHVTFADDFLLA
jgi:hypothetical protein